MNHDHDHHEPPRRPSSRAWIAFGVLAAIGAFFLIAEHRAHLYGVLPYVLLALCPLMHLFHGHGGHGGHGSSSGGNEGRKDA